MIYHAVTSLSPQRHPASQFEQGQCFTILVEVLASRDRIIPRQRIAVAGAQASGSPSADLAHVAPFRPPPRSLALVSPWASDGRKGPAPQASRRATGHFMFPTVCDQWPFNLNDSGEMIEANVRSYGEATLGELSSSAV